MEKEAVKVILVMGKSGSGKQPRIDCLSEEFGFCQISTGTLFRDRIGLFNGVGYNDNIKTVWDDNLNSFKSDDEILDLLAKNSKSPEKIISSKKTSIVLGAKAKFYVESGLFCPDSLTNDIFKHSFEFYFNCPLESCGSKNRGVILDGFPRTVNQVEFLIQLLKSHSLKIDFVLEVVLDDETIVRRTTGRRICPNCQGVYHLMFIPPRDGKYCTKCEGDVLVKQRADDSAEELLRKRLLEFQEKVTPVLRLLREVYQVPFVTVSGNLPDPSRTAVRRDVMSNVNVLFGIGDEDINALPASSPIPSLTEILPYLSATGVTAPLKVPQIIHLPSAFPTPASSPASFVLSPYPSPSPSPSPSPFADSSTSLTHSGLSSTSISSSSSSSSSLSSPASIVNAITKSIPQHVDVEDVEDELGEGVGGEGRSKAGGVVKEEEEEDDDGGKKLKRKRERSKERGEDEEGKGEKDGGENESEDGKSKKRRGGKKGRKRSRKS